MPATSLASKMKLKSGQHAAIIGAPEGYSMDLAPFPAGVEISKELKGEFDWIQIFVKSKSELEKIAPRAIRALKAESTLWISFPKGSSKIQTDLTRDKGWDILRKSNLKWITLISVNETWSAFSLRPFRPGEKRQSMR